MLDEPTASLDLLSARGRVTAREAPCVERHHDSFLSTTICGWAVKVCTRVLLLSRGRRSRRAAGQRAHACSCRRVVRRGPGNRRRRPSPQPPGCHRGRLRSPRRDASGRARPPRTARGRVVFRARGGGRRGCAVRSGSTSIRFAAAFSISPAVVCGERRRADLFHLAVAAALAAALVGGTLAAAGVVFQGCLRNPLATPYTLGVLGGRRARRDAGDHVRRRRWPVRRRRARRA